VSRCKTKRTGNIAGFDTENGRRQAPERAQDNWARCHASPARPNPHEILLLFLPSSSHIDDIRNVWFIRTFLPPNTIAANLFVKNPNGPGAFSHPSALNHTMSSRCSYTCIIVFPAQHKLVAIATSLKGFQEAFLEPLSYWTWIWDLMVLSIQRRAGEPYVRATSFNGATFNIWYCARKVLLL
jgi:hypothetical protein